MPLESLAYKYLLFRLQNCWDLFIAGSQFGLSHQDVTNPGLTKLCTKNTCDCATLFLGSLWLGMSEIWK